MLVIPVSHWQCQKTRIWKDRECGWCIEKKTVKVKELISWIIQFEIALWDKSVLSSNGKWFRLEKKKFDGLKKDEMRNRERMSSPWYLISYKSEENEDEAKFVSRHDEKRFVRSFDAPRSSGWSVVEELYFANHNSNNRTKRETTAIVTNVFFRDRSFVASIR